MPVKNLPTKLLYSLQENKKGLFDKWCTASTLTNVAQLRELVLLEEFNTCLPGKIVIYLNEQKME